MQTEQSSKEPLVSLPVSILVAALLISGSIIYAVWQGGSAPPAPPGGGPEEAPASVQALMAVRERDVIMGDPGAPVTIIEYGDYKCPFCARFFENVLPALRANYIETGKARIIYRDLAFLGPESQAASEAAECAKDQGKFWAYHDALYNLKLQNSAAVLDRALFLRLAGELDADPGEFAACIDSRRHQAVVMASTRSAQEVGINGTPTTLINGAVVQGAQPYAYFAAIIDDLLER